MNYNMNTYFYWWLYVEVVTQKPILPLPTLRFIY